MRPFFLSILCILTLIHSALQIYNSAIDLLHLGEALNRLKIEMNYAKELMEKFQESRTDSSFVGQIMVDFFKNLTRENIRLNAISLLLGNIGTFVGAMWMFNLQKKGLNLYLASQLFLIFQPLVIYEGISGQIITFSLLISGSLMIFLYYTQRSYLRH